jgi:hypothetical protein
MSLEIRCESPPLNANSRGGFFVYTETYKFLQLFRKPDETVIMGLLHENKNTDAIIKTSGVVHTELKMEKLAAPLNEWIGYYKKAKIFIHTYNKRGYGVYFIPNAGGTKNEQIDQIRSWFIDVDFAKIKEEFAEEGRALARKAELKKTGEFDELTIETANNKEQATKYTIRGLYNQKTIKKAKEAYLEKHGNDLKEAVLVETYSGFHGYWIAKDGSKEKFKKIQRALIRKFDSDRQIIKEAGLMRVPGFDHRKYKDPFLIKVVQWSDKQFTEEELIRSLGLQLLKQEKGFAKEEVQEKVSFASELTRSVNVIKRKEKSDLVLKKAIGPLTERRSFNEALQIVLSKPLTDFIDSPTMVEGESVKCPFHNDEKPSASVFVSNGGEALFHCHACSIGTRNVIGLHMAHSGKGWRQSVEDLSKMIGIKVIETEFEREQFQKYRDNRHYLEQDLETLLPYTAHFITRYGRKMYLRYFNDKAETTVLKEEFQYKNHNVFFISYRAIAKENEKKSMRAVQNTVILLNTLGFIERVPEDFVPAELKDRAEKERKILQQELRQQGEKGKRRADAARLINFYIVPNWNDTAYNIERNAKIMRNQGYSVNKHNNKIAIEQMLGKEVAQSVFPDKRKMPKRFESILNRLTGEIERSLKEKGYAIAEEIVRMQVRIKEKDKTVVVPLAEKEDVMKRAVFVDEGYEIDRIRSEQKKKAYGYHPKTPITIHIIKKI